MVINYDFVRIVLDSVVKMMNIFGVLINARPLTLSSDSLRRDNLFMYIVRRCVPNSNTIEALSILNGKTSLLLPLAHYCVFSVLVSIFRLVKSFNKNYSLRFNCLCFL